eukprot:gene7061-biopygen6695
MRHHVRGLAHAVNRTRFSGALQHGTMYTEPRVPALDFSRKCRRGCSHRGYVGSHRGYVAAATVAMLRSHRGYVGSHRGYVVAAT